jgi:2-methylcitrate dehydratase PrpD
MVESIEINTPDLVHGATRDLAIFASSLSYEDIPADVVTYVKELILDSLGVILFGNQTPWARMVAEMAAESEAAPRSTIFGRPIKTSAALAALANATGGHSFEYDEVHRDSATHPGSIIVPVVLALAQSEGHRNGRDLITAAVAAYEVGCRIGMTTGMGLFYRGHHPQGSVGVFFAATAASKVLRLDATKTQHALGIAGSHASGLMAAQEGAMVKRMHAGTAAQNGVYGAVLAQKGFTGIENVLEASFGGFINTFSESPRIEHLMAGLGTSWETLNIGYKPYSTVASIHSSLDGLLTMMRDNQLKADDIESLDIGCTKLTYHHCAWEYKPTGLTAAQMNLFFCLAMIAIDGDAGINQFKEDRLKDPEVLALISRITAHIDNEIEAKGRKHRYEVTLNLKTKDGRKFERREYHRRGTKEYPPHPGDVEKKFMTLVGEVFDLDIAQRLLSFIRNLEEKKSLDELFELLGRKQ